MDQSAQQFPQQFPEQFPQQFPEQFPQQWTPEPDPVGAQQHQQAGEQNRQPPHYAAPAPSYAPPQPQPQGNQSYPQQQQYPPQQPYPPQPYPQQPYPPQQQYAQPQYPQAPYPQPQYPQAAYPQAPYPAPPAPPAPQQPYPPQNPYPPQQQYVQPQYPQPQYPQQPYPSQPYPPQQYPQQPYPPQQQYPQPPAPQLPPDQSGGAPVSFPPPPNLPKVRDAFLNGAGPFLQPGEQVFYGFMLKLDATIEETPDELKIAIEGQHHVLGDVHRASAKMNRGLRWTVAPGEALSERLAEKATDAMFKALAGPVFAGGWLSQAGWFIRFVRATAEDYGPGAYGAVTNQRFLVFRGARLGGSAMRLVYAVPRTAIGGVRLENGKEALKHGRTPRAELHFTDGSMVATMMPGKQGEQLASVLAPAAY